MCLFSAHSTRSASTSKVLNRGISLTEICRVAGLSNCSTFAKHKKKPIMKKNFNDGILDCYKSVLQHV